jgi:hypothetical protein
MAALTTAFRALVNRIDLVREHSFDSGHDNGAYFNYTFCTNKPGELWQLVQSTIFQAPDFRDHLAAASMAMCSSEGGWHRYTQLYHWDPEVPVEPVPAL